jgi:hypothetical protein
VHTRSGRGRPQPDGHQLDDQIAVNIGKDEKRAAFNSFRRDAELWRTAIEQEQLDSTVRHDDTVESRAAARVLFWNSIIHNRLFWHETQAHPTIDPGRNYHDFFQRFSRTMIGSTSNEIDLAPLLYELRGQ